MSAGQLACRACLPACLPAALAGCAGLFGDQGTGTGGIGSGREACCRCTAQSAPRLACWSTFVLLGVAPPGLLYRHMQQCSNSADVLVERRAMQCSVADRACLSSQPTSWPGLCAAAAAAASWPAGQPVSQILCLLPSFQRGRGATCCFYCGASLAGYSQKKQLFAASATATTAPAQPAGRPASQPGICSLLQPVLPSLAVAAPAATARAGPSAAAGPTADAGRHPQIAAGAPTGWTS